MNTSTAQVNSSIGGALLQANGETVAEHSDKTVKACMDVAAAFLAERDAHNVLDKAQASGWKVLVRVTQKTGVPFDTIETLHPELKGKGSSYGSRKSVITQSVAHGIALLDAKGQPRKRNVVWDELKAAKAAKAEKDKVPATITGEGQGTDAAITTVPTDDAKLSAIRAAFTYLMDSEVLRAMHGAEIIALGAAYASDMEVSEVEQAA